MINRITDEMKKCVENECFIAALALALTLPDTCGKAEYPQENSTKKRYIDWYDKYVGFYEKPPSVHSKDMPYSSGEVVYSLRNHMLHQGTPNIDSTKIAEDRCKIDKFHLVIDSGYNGGISGVSYGMDMEIQERTLEINIVNLCSKIGAAAKSYYMNNPEKFSFIQYDLKDIRHAYDSLFSEDTYN